ncbi:DUF885 domain-containing protein [Thalassotalea sp. M1531]|uniref:DUF885 domain-containing protein n=1 Tax=Thalassotalea algicola TaxID=2716224 RepID=A0A7Y0Q5S1_9GAMM|nr:DUF885 domain-containing protein [Thalassotalea algicola]NMP30633.1 DUF885 domain-containing protein [Thalassotalea algicola]
MKYLHIILAFLLVACSQTTQKQKIDANEQLAGVIANYHSYEEQSSPYNKPEAGASNAQLPDMSSKKLAANHQKLKAIFEQVNAVDITKLDDNNKISWSVLHYRIKNQLDSYLNNEYLMPLTAESGFHAYLSFITRMVAFKTEQDYIDYLSRLNQVPNYFSQQMAWMRLGIEKGYTQPQIVLEGFEDSIKAFIKEDVTQSAYYQPFKAMPSHLDEATQANLKTQAKSVILEKVFPSYQQFYDFMVNTYKPNARKNIAASSLPNGKAYYDNRVKHFTTLDMTADEVHEIGLAEVKRIRGEMQTIIEQVGFEGSFADFVEFLRTDEQFYAKTPEELLKEASFIAKKMDAKLPGLFKTLPRTPYGVIEVPANIAPKYTTGRYSGPSRDDQPGNYWVNTYRLDRRPLYVLEALTLHEAVPGHHLQGSIAREMENVPKFRNQTYISAFGEGWGLYSEFLGIEAGFYQDPYSDFGRLTYEMWRACRLVVDTGMHVKGWSRDKAMNFLASNTALSLHNVKTEIDRYISWPGQALSYKIGELTIKRLRKEAEQALGANFDVREFHDRILENGSMPLSMLEKIIRQYIAEKKLSLEKK